jgi:hypothetical protein
MTFASIRHGLLAAVAATALLGAGSAANAHVYLTQLDWTNLGAGGAVQNGASQGQVTVTESNGSLDVLVELFNQMQFVDTGNANNHYAFTWNMAPPGADVDVTAPDPNADITHQHCTGPHAHPTCVTIVDSSAFSFHDNPGPYNQSAFGNFSAAFDCCGAGGSGARPSPLEYTVSATGITFLGSPSVGDGSHFYSNTAGWWFAADIVDGAGNTFLAAGRDAICQDCSVPSAPEPAAWSMMIIGFGMGGALLRRRRRAAVIA